MDQWEERYILLATRQHSLLELLISVLALLPIPIELPSNADLEDLQQAIAEIPRMLEDQPMEPVIRASIGIACADWLTTGDMVARFEDDPRGWRFALTLTRQNRVHEHLERAEQLLRSG